MSRSTHLLLALVALLVVACFDTTDAGQTCLVANGSGLVGSDGTCVIDACARSHDNCDGDNLNGCETVVLNDPTNCGGCDVTCGAGELCGDSACICGATRGSTGEAACAEGTVCCGDACVAPSDPSCACGDAPSCEAGALCCDDTCVFPDRSTQHCGACGVACGPTQGCLDGACINTLHATDPDSDFGFSVALSGDWAAVGSPATSPALTDATGSVQLFRRTDSGWVPDAVLTPTGDTVLWERSQFGLSVAMDGDILLVGAPFADPFPEQAGAGVVFQRSGDTWNQTHILVSDDGTAARIGTSTAIHGTNLLVGGPREDRVRFFEQPENEAGTLITAETETAGLIEFGTSVALTDTLLLVGAPEETAGDVNGAGRVHVYTHDAATDAWTRSTTLFASDPITGDRGAEQITVARDTVFMSSDNNRLDGGPAFAGAVYAFRPTGPTWSQQKLRASDAPTAAGRFGMALASDSERVLIGAGDTQRVYLFEFDESTSQWAETATLDPIPGTDTSRFGRAVALDGRHAVISSYGAVSFMLVP